MKRLAFIVAVLAVWLPPAAVADESNSLPADACGAGLPGGHAAGFDRDGDAIPDSEDWCPDTDAGTPVGYNGCAAWEVPVRCAADTPAVAPARPVPPRDGDADGVGDEADKCPGTPAGLAVDPQGCVQIGKVVLKGVNFATGSAKLLPAASETLRTVATAMKADPQVEVEIGGHTDSVGLEARNQRLSLRRAESVKAFLVGEGVEARRLSTKGYGESQPADSNQTPEGRANNRRVEFKTSR